MDLYSLINVMRPLAQMNQNNTASNMLSNIIGIGGAVAGGLIALFLIYSIVKDAIAFAKGNGDGSVIKIIGKVVFLIACIGLVIIALNWSSIGEKAAGLGNTILNAGESIGNDILNP